MPKSPPRPRMSVKQAKRSPQRLLPGRPAKIARDPIANAKYPLSTMLRQLSEPVYRSHARIISTDGIEHPPSNDLILPGWPKLYGGNKRGQRQDHPKHRRQKAYELATTVYYYFDTWFADFSTADEGYQGTYTVIRVVVSAGAAELKAETELPE